MEDHEKIRMEVLAKLRLKAKLFKGFGDASRLAIIQFLRAGEKSVTEIVEASGLSQANVSAHLNCLKESGLVASRSEGRNNIYYIANEKVLHILDAAEQILQETTEEMLKCMRY